MYEIILFTLVGLSFAVFGFLAHEKTKHLLSRQAIDKQDTPDEWELLEHILKRDASDFDLDEIPTYTKENSNILVGNFKK
jgi:hypothetical protein